ncbi:MAG: hypothetical protein OEU36_17570 [Gammaproteobacteria bacterium]|nr:hypothetical protein [Gammaproteobacteria bacterium]
MLSGEKTPPVTQEALIYAPTLFDQFKLPSWKRRTSFILMVGLLYFSLSTPFYLPDYGPINIAIPILVLMATSLGARRSMLLVMVAVWAVAVKGIILVGYPGTSFSLMVTLLAVALFAGRCAELGWARYAGSTLILVLVSVAVGNWDYLFNHSFPTETILTYLLAQTAVTGVLVLLAGPVAWKQLRGRAPGNKNLILFIEEHRMRRPLHSRFLGASLVVIAIIALLGLLAMIVVFEVADLEPIHSVVLVALGAILVLIVNKGFSVGPKVFASGVADTLRDDPRRPVLFLRSFSADEKGAREVDEDVYGYSFIPDMTEEEAFTKVLRQVGPVVAIGRPGERLPQRGAARVYVSDDKWKAVVERLMRESRLVVIRAGSSAGLQWEFAKARDNLKPSQLILVAPADEHSYQDMRSWAQDALGITLPEYRLESKTMGSLGNLIYFQEEWQPQQYCPTVKGRMRKQTQEEQTQEGLLGVLSQLGIDIKLARHRRQWLALIVGVSGYLLLELDLYQNVF